MTPDEPEPASPPIGPVTDLRGRYAAAVKGADDAVKLAGALSLALLLVSYIVASMMFESWGLSFASIAGVSDIVMTGVDALYDVATLSFALVLGGVAGVYLSFLCRRLHDHPWDVRGFLVRLVPGAVLGLLFAIGVLLRNIEVEFLSAASALCGAGAGFALLGWSRRSPVALPTVLFLSLLCFAGCVTARFGQHFNENPWALYVDVDPARCPRAHVLWIGDKSIVARCPSKAIVVLPRGSPTLFREGASANDFYAADRVPGATPRPSAARR